MKRWWQRKWVGWAAVAISLAVIAIGAFVVPAPHAVNSPGATRLSVAAYQLDQARGRYFNQLAADESLATVECTLWRSAGPNRGKSCDPADPSWQLYPTAKQEPSTLYLTWYGCIDWHGAGPIIPWQGFNFEYLAATRSVIVHCYKAAPYLYTPEKLFGMAGFPIPGLFAIPDGSFGPGNVYIDEDDRLEHLVGDQTVSEFQLTAANI